MGLMDPSLWVPRADSVALEFRVRSQEAQDLAPGKDSLQVSIGNYGQLVDVLAAHQSSAWMAGVPGVTVRS